MTDKKLLPIIRKILYKSFSTASQEFGRLPSKEETLDVYIRECSKAFDEEFDLMCSDLLSKSMGVIPLETRVCRDCGKVFGIDKGELDYYNKHGLHLPTRCKACRKKRKDSIDANE